MIDTCPCGSAHGYSECCGAYIEGIKTPTTPEALMRSRYTAYTQQKIDYIEKTMRGNAMKRFNKKEAYAWSKGATWLGLEVIYAKTEGQTGEVEFIASFMINNKKESIREVSEFSYIEGCWYYVDGKHV